MNGPVDLYLAELRSELRVGRRPARRILAEAEAHLADRVAEFRDEGAAPRDAEVRAVAAFGAPAPLAREFALQLARDASRDATRATVVLLAAFAGLVALLSSGRVKAVGPWANDLPYGLVVLVAFQVAAVAGGLTLMRWKRMSVEGDSAPEALVLVTRGATTAAAALAVVVAVGSVLALVHVDTLTGSGWGIAVAASLGVAAILVVGCAGLSLRAVMRTKRAGVGRRAVPADPFGDVAVLARAVAVWAQRRHPRLARHAGDAIAGAVALGRRAPRLVTWFHLSHHPWRFATSVAVACGLALAAGHGLTDGGVPSLGEVPMALAGGLAIAALEGLAVMIGFATLGGFLGIRPALSQH